METDFTKKSGVTPMVLEKLKQILTMYGTAQEKIDKVMEILGGEPSPEGDNHADTESKQEDTTDTVTEKEEDVAMVDPKKKLSMPSGIKVVCISE